MNANALKESLYFYNPWWETARVPPELLKEYQRPVIKNLLSYFSLDRIIVLKGPRRTGKTILFYQIIDNLLKKGVPHSDILFLSLDDIKLRRDLDEIFKAYQEIHRRLIKEGPPIYVFLDEVHFLENWQFSAKKYFDRKYPLKFLASGSSATLIRKGTESLAGRTVDETIYPFSFYEFFCYQSKNPRIMEKVHRLRESFAPMTPVDTTDLTPYLPEIKIIFEEYLERGGFPNLFGMKEAVLWKRLVKEDILEKVIYRDLVTLYDIKKPEVLEKLFYYLADITSEILSITNIANSLGLSREFAEKYIFYLEQALLVRRLKKFSKSVEKSLRSNEKVHLLDSGLVNAFSKVEEGQVLESIVASHLIRRRDENVYYYRNIYEVDLVLEKGKKVFPVEVKYKDSISKRDLAGLLNFKSKFKPEVGVVVTRDLSGEDNSYGLRILFFPAWLFLLLVG